MLDDTILISFSGSEVHREYQRTFHINYDKYFAKSIQYDLDWIKNSEYYDLYKNIFAYRKYAGFFLWKPIIIKHTLELYPDYKVLYSDANIVFDDMTRFENNYKRQMDNTHYFFIKHWNRINRDWTKRDTFIIMDADIEKYHNAHQVWTVLEGWESSRYDVLMENLKYCTNEHALVESPNIYDYNYPGFQAHRWEQSIISILVEKYNIDCPLDLEFVDILHKDYNTDLVKQKEEEEKDPLKKE